MGYNNQQQGGLICLHDVLGGTIGWFPFPCKQSKGTNEDEHLKLYVYYMAVLLFYHCWPKNAKGFCWSRGNPLTPGEFSLHAHQFIHRTGKPRKSQTNRQLLPFKPQFSIVTPPKTNVFSPQNRWLEDFSPFLPFEMASKIEDIRSFSGAVDLPDTSPTRWNICSTKFQRLRFHLSVKKTWEKHDFSTVNQLAT